MNAHGVNLPLLKAHARLLKWQKLYLPVFLLATNSKKNNQLKWKILALMLIVQHAMLQMNAHGASQLQSRVHARQLKWQRLFHKASLHVINFKKKSYLWKKALSNNFLMLWMEKIKIILSFMNKRMSINLTQKKDLMDNMKKIIDKKEWSMIIIIQKVAAQ